MEIINKYYIKNDIHFNESGNKKIFDILQNYEFGAPDRVEPITSGAEIRRSIQLKLPAQCK